MPSGRTTPGGPAGAFEALADLFPGMVWCSDAENRIFFANRSWVEFTGREFPGDRDLDWRELVHPEDVSLVSQVFDAASTTLSALSSRFRLLRAPTAATRRFFLRGRPLATGKSGRFCGFIGDCVEDQVLKAGGNFRSRADDINHRG